MATRVADERRGRRLLGSLAAQLGFDFGESEPINPAVAPTPRQPRSEDKSAISGSAEPISQVIGLPSWQHPLATHQIKLPTAYIGYHLKRGKRRTIGMSVGMDGLVVQAPRWVGMAEIESVLREKGVWLLAKLSEMQARQNEQLKQRIGWRDGAQFPVLDRAVQVVLNPTHATAPAGGQLQTKAGEPVKWRSDGGWEPETMPPEEPLELHLALPFTAGATQIKDASQAWLMRFSKQVFLSRLDRYAPELGVQYQALRLSSANTRWGSADAKGHIRLNWRLIHGPLSSLDYVVVHELSHLREMNHSAKFWGTVASVLPDYAGERRRLNALQLPVW